MTDTNRYNGQNVNPPGRGDGNGVGSGGRVHTYGMGRGAAPAAPRGDAGAGHAPGGASGSAPGFGLHAGQPADGQPSVGQAGRAGGSPQPHSPQPQQPQKKRGASFWIAIVVALVCIVLACVLALTMCGNGKGQRQGEAGQLEGKTPEEIQAELDRIVEEGMFNISIASYVEFPDGTAPGELRIENVPGNQYLMSVEITLDDTGQTVYETALIEPNHHIQQDRLSVDLDPGTYEATATFFAYDDETEELMGQAAAKITINVLG